MPEEDFTRHLGMSVKGLRIGVPRTWMREGLDPEVAASIESVLDFYRSEGAEIVEIDLRQAELGVPVYYVVACAEASSNLSRFDGVRYGHRAKDYTDIIDMIAAKASGMKSSAASCSAPTCSPAATTTPTT